jgi:hypothetical protein
MLENKSFLLLSEFALDHKGMYTPVQGVLFLYKKHRENYPFGVWLKYNSHRSFYYFIMGKPLTVEFFYKILRLLNGK